MLIQLHAQFVHNYLKKKFVNSDQEFATERGHGRGGFNPKVQVDEAFGQFR